MTRNECVEMCIDLIELKYSKKEELSALLSNSEKNQTLITYTEGIIVGIQLALNSVRETLENTEK